MGHPTYLLTYYNLPTYYLPTYYNLPTFVFTYLLQPIRLPIWRTPKSRVEPTWGFNYVELRKVGTWKALPTSSTKEG
jgi:hypothetical protein